MKEAPEQYIARILGNLGAKNAIAVQRATPAKLEKAIKRLTPAQLRTRPEPGVWSIAEVITHLRDAELVVGFRLRMAVAQSSTPLQAFDQDLWAQHCNYAKEDARKTLTEFRVLREANHRLLKGIPKPVWENYGIHAERGKETVTHMTRMIAGHDVNHLRQIEQRAAALRKKK